MSDRQSPSGDQAWRQVPGVHRILVGDIRVTALNDGYLDLDQALFPNADPALAGRLLEARFLPQGYVRAAINAYAVESGGQVILIDTGGGTLVGPTADRLQASLATAAIDPASVDSVLLTHAHPDHVGGLATDTGEPVFPNAELVLHDREFRFWTDEDALNRTPDQQKSAFQAARRAFSAYPQSLRRLERDGALVAPGITAVELPGHTPGHTGYKISSGDDQLFIWGDIVHAAALQFACPAWGVAFDSDGEAAASTRARVFAETAAERTLVAGMHLPFPGLGHVVSTEGGYSFVPAEWRYDP